MFLWVISLFFFSWWAWLEAYQFYLKKKKTNKTSSWLHWPFLFIYIFCYLFWLWSVLFPSFFWLWALLILLFLIPLYGRNMSFSDFLQLTFIAINFCFRPLRTAFAVSHRSWNVVFSFSFVWVISFCPLYVFIYLFFCTCLYFFHFSSCNWFQILCCCGWKHTWYNFSLLEFVEIFFVVYHVICTGEFSTCTWNKSVFWHFWMECLVDI